MLDVIKEYLVGLGFQVNMNEYNKAKQAIEQVGKTVQSQTAGMAKNFTAASTAIAGALAGVTAATSGLVTHVAKADMEYQKLALRMWTTKQTAKEMQIALDAIGESIEDVAFIPELRDQYFQLLNQGRSMQTPADADGQLKNMRSIMFEFKRLKLEATYAMEWVAYYLNKYLGDPINKIKTSLKDFNDKLSADMPNWTKKVASALASVANIGRAAFRFIQDIFSGLSRVFDMLPGKVKLLLAVLAAFSMSPIIAGLTFFLLLLEDFYGYIDGKKSSKTLAPVWKQLIEWFEQAKEWGTSVMPRLSNAWDKFEGLIKDVKDLLKDILAIFKDLVNGEIGKKVIELFSVAGTAVDNLVLGVINLMKQLTKLLKIGFNSSPFKSFLEWFLRMTLAIGKAILGIVDVIGLALQGRFADASRRGVGIMGDLWKDIGDAGYPFSPRTARGGAGMTASSDPERIRKAIGLVESSNNANEPPNFAGASGKYQFVQGTWDSVARQAGRFDLIGIPPYMASEEDQDQLAQFYVNQLYSRYGGRADMIAAAWYGGEGYADSLYQGNPSFDPNSPQAGGMPSVNDHIAKVMDAMNSIPSTVASPAPTTNNTATVTVGDIYIGGTNATPAEISNAVAVGVQRGQDRRYSIMTRELSGVIG